MKTMFLGDTHGNWPFLKNAFAHASRNECDLIIQLGDFGYGWSFEIAAGATTHRARTGQIDWFSARASELVDQTEIPLWWLPGNHENYDHLYSIIDPESLDPAEIADNVTYLPRGCTFDFDGIRFMACGGATSVDKNYRKPHESWWPQEEITFHDVDVCKEQGKVDVLLTHDFPWEANPVDRHLAPHWGVEAQEKTIASRKKISDILSWCDADLLVHGHLHLPYHEDIFHPHHGLTREMHKTHVIGLNCDDTPLSESTYIFDTQEYKEKQ